MIPPPATTAVLLVRHAQSAANADGALALGDDDVPLTAAGHAQAAALVEHLRGTPVDAIVTSDALRARQTVEPLASSRGLTPWVTPLLREPCAGRRAETFADAAQVAALIAGLANAPGPRAPRTETHRELVARLRRFVDALRARPRARCVVVCSHFVTLNVLLRLWIDTREPPAAWWAHFDNASVSRVDLALDDARACGVVRYLNRVP